MTDAALAELLRAVLARPDDHDVLRIYADCLLARDDARGELIVIQLERGATPELIAREREVIARLDAALAIELGQPGFAAAWRHGFLEAVDFTPLPDRRALADTLRDLGRLAAARRLRRLVIRFVEPGWGSTGPIIATLTKIASQLRALRELVFTTSARDDANARDDAKGMPHQLGDLTALLHAVPRLEVLELASTTFATLRGLSSPALRRLVLDEPNPADVAVAATARIPNLEELAIHHGNWRADQLAPLLARSLPLRHLALATSDRDSLRLLCRNVPDAILFRTVKTFALGGKLDRTCVEYLVHHAVHLRRLERFEVDEAGAPLRRALGEVLVSRGER